MTPNSIEQSVQTNWTVALLLIGLTLGVPLGANGSPVVPGQLDVSSSTQSIGVQWSVSGDTDHDAICVVEYRESGTSAWKQGMPLVRVDSSNGNSLSGSIMFVMPNTRYELRLAMSDPDGGAETRITEIDTAPEHELPLATRTLHVIPGNGGGSGTLADPYRGLIAAWSQAQPGDELLLHGGHYGGVDDNNGASGDVGNPIVIRSAGDGDAEFSFIQVAQHDNLWFEGLTFIFDGSSDTGFYSSLLYPGYDNGFQPMLDDVNNIALVRHRFEGFKHSIRAGPRTRGWYIADNVIVGDKQLGATGTASFDGEGIELGHGSDHEVAYNSITLVGDGVSFPERNCDIYGNDIFDVTDDGIELDFGQSNTRIWQNRIHNASHNGLAFQPQAGAPWYIVRNQLVNMQESVIKFRGADRFVAVNNTFVNWGKVVDHWSHQLFRGITRNNLWISVNNGPIWQRADEGMNWQTDLDYDGFDWGTNSAPFDVNNVKYANLGQLRAATGQHINSIRIDAGNCFESFDVPGPPPLVSVPAQSMSLQSSCTAIDAGISIPNISDTFNGAAPDLGAFEFGNPNPGYGPRAGNPQPPTNRPPVANAGADQAGNEGTSIFLSGMSSSDPDGDSLTYAWSQTAGPSATIATPNQVTTNISLPQVNASESLLFLLTVTDQAGASATDTVSVTVNDVQSSNRAPIANAGADRNGDEGSTTTLSGANSSDPDGDPLSYSWAQLSGPSGMITNSTGVTAVLTLPQVSTTSTIVIQLTVTDPSGAFASDTVSVIVNDVSTAPPAAKSGGSFSPVFLLSLATVIGPRIRRRRLKLRAQPCIRAVRG